MDYATPSETLLRLALVSGLVVFLLTLILVAAIAVLRTISASRAQRQRELTERWLPVFHHAIEGLALPPSPDLKRRDSELVLGLWVRFFQSLRGQARANLRRLAFSAGLDRCAHLMLQQRSTASRVLAVVALGSLRDHRVRDELLGLANDDNPMLSLLASRALLQINPYWAAPLLLANIGRRDDWPLTRIGAIFDEVPAKSVAPHLSEALRWAPPSGTPRLLALLEVVHVEDSWPLLEPLLDPRQTPDILAAALKATHDPRGRAPVRELAAHSAWVVRAQAAAALGRLGLPEDVPLLRNMLNDPVWWVRYRAAGTLARLPFVSRETLSALARDDADRFARDILRQVLAETGVAQ